MNITIQIKQLVSRLGKDEFFILENPHIQKKVEMLFKNKKKHLFKAYFLTVKNFGSYLKIYAITGIIGLP